MTNDTRKKLTKAITDLEYLVSTAINHEWHSVLSDHPSHSERVIVCDREGNLHFAYFDMTNKEYQTLPDYKETLDVLWWMESVKPPF